jgi:L-2-hydroxyglutarate oxidase
MCNRVKQFIPAIDSKMLNERGLAGVRSSLIDANGFVPEAVTIESGCTFHVLNYNSPGATGAPAFSAYLVKRMGEKGYLDGLRKRANRQNSDLWQFENASDL